MSIIAENIALANRPAHRGARERSLITGTNNMKEKGDGDENGMSQMLIC
jgi:hypothetical protein